MVTAQMAYITPPFGYAMFAFKGVVPDVEMKTIFHASLPIVGLFLLAMLIVYFIPGIATVLPGML